MMASACVGQLIIRLQLSYKLNQLAKGRILHSKMRPFAMRFAVIYKTKDGLSETVRFPFCRHKILCYD